LYSEYQLTDVNRDVIDKAVVLVQSQPLRGYDAVQISTALNSRAILTAAGIIDFIFLSADRNLISAASVEGLKVENPDNHL
jgi:uncharacterized protein